MTLVTVYNLNTVMTMIKKILSYTGEENELKLIDMEPLK